MTKRKRGRENGINVVVAFSLTLVQITHTICNLDLVQTCFKNTRVYLTKVFCFKCFHKQTAFMFSLQGHGHFQPPVPQQQAGYGRCGQLPDWNGKEPGPHQQ